MTVAEYRPWEDSAAAGVTTLDKQMYALGWERWVDVGPTDSSLWISSWIREVDGRSEYVAYLDDGCGDARPVRATSLVEMMDLLARWAPIIQAEAIAQIVDDLRSGNPSEFNVVGRVVAKALKATGFPQRYLTDPQ